MTVSAQHQRRLNSAHRKLSVFEEDVVAGWVITRDSLHQSTSTTSLREFLWKSFRLSVSSSWITRFNARNHFSLKQPSLDTHHETTREVIAEGMQKVFQF